jgi:hypothetical protein
MSAATRPRCTVEIRTRGTNFRNATFDLVGGVVTNTTAGTTPLMLPLGGGLYLCSISTSLESGATTPYANVYNTQASGVFSYAGDGASYTNFWRGQAEVGGFPSAYIKSGAGAVMRSPDAFTFPLNIAPFAMTMYAKFVEQGSLLDGNNAPIMYVGKSDGSRPLVQLFASAGVYRAYHEELSGSSSISALAVPNIGDLVELRGVLNGDGTMILGQSINGSAEVVTGTSAAPQALTSAWSAATIAIGSRGADRYGFYLAQIARIAGGAQSLATMQAA